MASQKKVSFRDDFFFSMIFFSFPFFSQFTSESLCFSFPPSSEGPSFQSRFFIFSNSFNHSFGLIFFVPPIFHDSLELHTWISLCCSGKQANFSLPNSRFTTSLNFFLLGILIYFFLILLQTTTKFREIFLHSSFFTHAFLRMSF